MLMKNLLDSSIVIDKSIMIENTTKFLMGSQ